MEDEVGVLVIERYNLNLRPEQRAALDGIEAVANALGEFRNSFSETLLGSVGPLLMQAAAATVSQQCPFGNPPADIVGDFDGQKNMYFHCLHAIRHCWTWGGQHITCPR